jgi:hypothetical protein
MLNHKGTRMIRKGITVGIILFLLLSTSLVGVFNKIPVQALNQTDMSPDDEQYLSSLEVFLQRKAYPYEYTASEYRECFIQNLNTEVDEQTVVASSSVPSVFGLSGPMNSSWPMKSFNAQRIGRTASSTVDNPGIEK